MLNIIVCDDCNTKTTSKHNLNYCPNCSSSNIILDYELWEKEIWMQEEG